MAFDFNKIINDKKEHIQNLGANAKYHLLLNDIERFDVFNGQSYETEINPAKNTLSVFFANSQVYIEPRLIFKFNKNNTITIYKRAYNRIVYFETTLIKLIKNSQFIFSDFYAMDKDGNIYDSKAQLGNLSICIINHEDSEFYDKLRFEFWKYRLYTLKSSEKEFVFTPELVNKLPIFHSVKKFQFTRDLYFSNKKAARLLCKKFIDCKEFSGYSADSTFTEKLKNKKAPRFITIYNFEKDRAYSALLFTEKEIINII